MQYGASVTWCAGRSNGKSDLSSEPMKNLPPGMRTIPSAHAGAGGFAGAGAALGMGLATIGGGASWWRVASVPATPATTTREISPAASPVREGFARPPVVRDAVASDGVAACDETGPLALPTIGRDSPRLPVIVRMGESPTAVR